MAFILKCVTFKTCLDKIWSLLVFMMQSDLYLLVRHYWERNVKDLNYRTVLLPRQSFLDTWKFHFTWSVLRKLVIPKSHPVKYDVEGWVFINFSGCFFSNTFFFFKCSVIAPHKAYFAFCLGDTRQLPSIDPGNVLLDIFESLKPRGFSVELRTNHRAESQLIVDNATR